jgi:hypothetical protein
MRFLCCDENVDFYSPWSKSLSASSYGIWILPTHAAESGSRKEEVKFLRKLGTFCARKLKYAGAEARSRLARILGTLWMSALL